jgi:hypothetical protein
MAISSLKVAIAMCGIAAIGMVIYSAISDRQIELWPVLLIVPLAIVEAAALLGLQLAKRKAQRERGE